jgi:hypothetical protein
MAATTNWTCDFCKTPAQTKGTKPPSGWVALQVVLADKTDKDSYFKTYVEVYGNLCGGCHSHSRVKPLKFLSEMDVTPLKFLSEMDVTDADWQDVKPEDEDYD